MTNTNLFFSNVAYWCWIGDTDSQPAVLFQDSREAESLKTLNKRIKAAKGAGHKGTATLLPDGRVLFCGLEFGEAQFNTLADYAKSESQKSLYHLRVVQIDKAGNVASVHESADVWPEPHHPLGSIERIVHMLESVQTGWFWFGVVGDVKYVLLTSQETDATGDVLRSQIRSLAHLFETEPSQCLGIITRNESGHFTLTTEAELANWLPEYRNWFAQHSEQLPLLRTLRVARIVNSELIEFQRMDDGDTSEVLSPRALPEGYAASITDIPEGKKCGFVFSDASGLLVSRSKSELKDHYVTLSNDRVRGQIERTNKGFFLFVVKSEGLGILSRIAQWWQACSGSETLPELAGARLVQQDSEGGVVMREKNNLFWAQE